MTAAFEARKRKNNQIGTLRKPGQSAKVGVVLQKKKITVIFLIKLYSIFLPLGGSRALKTSV